MKLKDVSTSVRIALFALACGAVRFLASIGWAWYASHARETEFGVLFDLPTVGMMLLAGALFGSPDGVGGLTDRSFMVWSGVTWTILGAGLASMFFLIRRHRAHSHDDRTA